MYLCAFKYHCVVIWLKPKGKHQIIGPQMNPSGFMGPQATPANKLQLRSDLLLNMMYAITFDLHLIYFWFRL